MPDLKSNFLRPRLSFPPLGQPLVPSHLAHNYTHYGHPLWISPAQSVSSCIQVETSFDFFDQKATSCGFTIRSMLRKEYRMAKYGKSAQRSVKRAMHKLKEGSLKSGKSGTRVRSRKQAIAIGLSEARRKGAKVPAE
jgi:hypothetical protein